MLSLVGDVRTKVPSHNAMPRWVVLLVEFLLDERGDVLLDVVALKCLRRDVDRVLLHVLSHVSVLDDGLPVCHT